ncbi:MAG: deoxyguanosinetriphosphate triphosphohydrolase [Pseudomonadota bacterium]
MTSQSPTPRLNWSQLLTSQRLGKPTSALSAADASSRSDFHRDYDRIVFSYAFRRMARKTQVHPLARNDHIHNRLIHSIEVASLGRTMGRRLGEALQSSLSESVTPEDLGVILQAAALAHDIGNPPFGHTGEDAIRDWFRDPTHSIYLEPLTTQAQRNDFLFFEGNAQGFRILTTTEKHYGEGGLRLTFPTLGAMLKYPWLSTECPTRSKFGCFTSEQNILKDVAHNLGLQPLVGISTDIAWCRHPLSYLLEAADDMCYRILDLEDAVELNILSWADFVQTFRHFVDTDRLLANENNNQPIKSKMTLLRGRAMDSLLDTIVKTFLHQQDALLSGELCLPLLSSTTDQATHDFMNQARLIAERRIFTHEQKAEIEMGAYSTLDTLLSLFIPAVYECHQKEWNNISKKTRCAVSLLDEKLVSLCQQRSCQLYELYLHVLDFISGMTDDYCIRLANQVRGIF